MISDISNDFVSVKYFWWVIWGLHFILWGHSAKTAWVV